MPVTTLLGDEIKVASKIFNSDVVEDLVREMVREKELSEDDLEVFEVMKNRLEKLK